MQRKNLSTRRASRRRAISLLEVLVSIFILLFGLLGVAAMLPLAGFRIKQINQSDSAAACGRSALADIKVRRMLDSDHWLRWDPSASKFAGFNPSSNKSYAIDPLGYAHDVLYRATNPPTVHDNLLHFPYISSATNSMARVSFVQTSGATPEPWELGLADRVFTWYDDLKIAASEDDTQRPKVVTIGDNEDINGNGTLDSGEDTNGNGVLDTPFALANHGNYSWLATVTPESKGLYRVSAVVFYNRDFSPPDAPIDPDMPGERMVSAEFPAGAGGGYGGGEVRLFLPNGSPAPPAYLNVKEGQWLMLCGKDGARDVFHWYRVVVVDEDPAEPSGSSDALWERYVTLAGPDWNTGDSGFGWCTGVDTDANSNMHEVKAALFTGVIGVYTTTMEL